MGGGGRVRRLRAEEPGAIEAAAAALRAGELVAFPTETVYGLGANALDAAAAARIFAAKGRPADNPLIVHIADEAMRELVAAEWPEAAAALAAAFWPGPLTLVVPRSPRVPDVVTAGLPTVAVRFPDHDVALALIRAAGVPVAAPSANRSGRPSPTTADDVLADYAAGSRASAGESAAAAPRPAIVLDGGPVPIGVESTVVDCTGPVPCVLRPGGVSLEELREILPDVRAAADAEALRRSPGTRYRHYAPSVPLTVFRGPGARVALLRALADAAARGEAVAVLAPSDTAAAARAAGRARAVVDAGPRERPAVYAAALYRGLRELEASGAARILAESPAPDGLGWAVRDRLARAAAQVVDAPLARVLFVCTGNTCRSPMAEALARRLAAQRGLPLEFASAGTHAAAGEAATPEAAQAVRRLGAELEGHASRAVTPELLQWADLVVAMTPAHAERLRRQHPEHAPKVATWDEIFGGGDVPDPIGLGQDAYDALVDRMAGDLRRWFQTAFGGAPA
ncbi:MAG: threonylcarbamoyl-AMP synthase [Firmicutes bacterium]|nr:threonylcarbamoyl-AMP synthase [Bacillota bacterium]